MTATSSDRPVMPKAADDPAQPRLYLAVIAVEVVVLTALWAFGRYFSS